MVPNVCLDLGNIHASVVWTFFLFLQWGYINIVRCNSRMLSA